MWGTKKFLKEFFVLTVFFLKKKQVCDVKLGISFDLCASGIKAYQMNMRHLMNITTVVERRTKRIAYSGSPDGKYLINKAK